MAFNIKMIVELLKPNKLFRITATPPTPFGTKWLGAIKIL